MFAAITPCLISGAFAERKGFGAFVVFTLIWSLVVYSPLAHMVWSTGGWLFQMGALDFAGGTVVHISSGVSALVVAFVIGKRRTGDDKMDPHDVPMTLLGAGLLWFGWFGFNAGSALMANGLASTTFVATNTAAAAATVTWVLAQYIHHKKFSAVGAACGAVAGLVAITPASGFVTPGAALIIGLVAGGLCYSATLLKARLKVDDALDVFAVHGVGGIFGALATGVFATRAINPLGQGAIDGKPEQVWIQFVAVAFTVVFAGVRHVRHRQGHREGRRTPGLVRGRGHGHRPGRARRGRLPDLDMRLPVRLTGAPALVHPDGGRGVAMSRPVTETQPIRDRIGAADRGCTRA